MSPKTRKLIASLFFILGLYVMLKEIIIPIAFNAAKSDLFLDGSEDNGSLLPTTSALADTAFKHCNTYIAQELNDAKTRFADKPINVWDIGSYTFVVNSEIEVQGDSGAPEVKKYVCRIKYGEGDQNALDNWSVYGIDGVEGI